MNAENRNRFFRDILVRRERHVLSGIAWSHDPSLLRLVLLECHICFDDRSKALRLNFISHSYLNSLTKIEFNAKSMQRFNKFILALPCSWCSCACGVSIATHDWIKHGHIKLEIAGNSLRIWDWLKIMAFHSLIVFSIDFSILVFYYLWIRYNNRENNIWIIE